MAGTITSDPTREPDLISSEDLPAPKHQRPEVPGILFDRLQQGNGDGQPVRGPSIIFPWRGLLLAACLLLATWFTQRPLPSWTSSNPSLNVYVAQPVIWSLLGFIAWRVYRALPNAPSFNWQLVGIGGIAGVFQVSAIMLSGLVVGYADNAGAGLLGNYPRNALYFTTLIVGIEMGRAAVFHSLSRVNAGVAYVTTTIVLAIVATPVGEWGSISSIDTLFQVGLGRYLPTLTVSAVATSFVAVGGLFASAAYRWPVAALAWLLPIVPDYGWAARALIGTAVPIGAYLVARTLYAGADTFEVEHPQEVPDAGRSMNALRSWILTAVVAVLIVLFVNGAFGLRPHLLTGISMEPGFDRGDVVIIREVPVESLEVSDIIRFRMNGIDYMHRIVDVVDEDGEVIFVTKGDNVDLPDPPVLASQIDGKAVFVLPRIGLPSLWLRDAFGNS